MIIKRVVGPFAQDLYRILSEQLQNLEEPLIDGLSDKVMDRAMSDEFLNDIREPMVKVLASQIAKEIQALQKEYADISAKLKKEYETKIATLEGSLTTLNTTVASAVTDVAGQDRKRRSDRTEVDQRIDGLSTAVSTTATTLNQQVKDSITSQNEKLTKMRKDLDEQLNSIQVNVANMTLKLENAVKEITVVKNLIIPGPGGPGTPFMVVPSVPTGSPVQVVASGASAAPISAPGSTAK